MNLIDLRLQHEVDLTVTSQLDSTINYWTMKGGLYWSLHSTIENVIAGIEYTIQSYRD